MTDVDAYLAREPLPEIMENPKTVAGSVKIDFSTIPPLALLYLAGAHDSGALKYDAHNWRETPIPARTYIAAAQRHIMLWASGIETDYEVDERGELILDEDGQPIGSGLPHLAMAMANLSILIDAQAAGMMIDNRCKTPGFDAALRHVMQLKKGWPRKAA
jgi:hypothetical protein